MLRTSLLAASLMGMSGAVIAAPYSYEATVNHAQADADFTETDTTVVTGTYYFKPVTVGDAPLAEAAFMARASSVSLSFTRRSFDAEVAVIEGPTISFDPNIDLSELTPITNAPANPGFVAPAAGFVSFFPVPSSALGDDENIWGIDIRYVSPAGWIGDVGYSTSSNDESFGSLNFTFSTDVESSRLKLGVGKYVGAATTVTLTYEDQSTEFRRLTQFTGMTPVPAFPPIFIPPSSSRSDSSVHAYTLAGKTLINQGRFTHAVNARLGYDVLENDNLTVFEGPLVSPQSFSDKSYALRTGVGYVFYPRQNLGLGLAYSVNDAEFGTDKSLDVSVEWFVTPDISLEARYLRTDAPSSFLDTDGFGVSITGRL